MTKPTPMTNANCEVQQRTAVDLRHFKPADKLSPRELLKEMGLTSNTLEQKNRIIYLSLQLSTIHLLENEAMDVASGDGLE